MGVEVTFITGKTAPIIAFKGFIKKMKKERFSDLVIQK